jgi:predicted transcriptional regulator
MSTKFAEYLDRHRFTNAAFAEAMKATDPGLKVTGRTVESWRYGRALPRRRALAAIVATTGMEVKADDFIGPLP